MTAPRPEPPARGRPEGELLTFLIADVRGYTRFTQEEGDEAAARLAATFAEIVREGVEARNGSVIELRGDEALAAFGSPRQALRAAVDLQAIFADEVRLRPSLPLHVGIGLDVGEAVPVEGGYRGGALNLAARLCSQAGPGEILASQEVTHLARALSGLRYEEHGAVEVKGIDSPVRVIRVTAGAIESRAGAADPRATSKDRQRAALPPALDPLTPLLGREAEARWLRWSWRRARRGAGHAAFVEGGRGSGRTRLAAEPAALAAADGASVAYASAAVEGSLDRVLERAEAEDGPLLAVLDDLDAAGDDAIGRTGAVLDAFRQRPTLVVATIDAAVCPPALRRLLSSATDAGLASHRRLPPLAADAVRQIAALYLDEPSGPIPAQAMLEASDGVPARVHELAASWARHEASRRLGEAVSEAAAGRSRLRLIEAELTANVIDFQMVVERASLYGRDATVGETRDDAPPFKGLASFDVEDAHLFFGRERLVAELVGRLAGAGFLGVVGPSGSGKSSAVRAGLIPAIAAGTLPGSERWTRVLMRPGEHPMRELDRNVFAALPTPERAALGGDVDVLAAASGRLGDDARLVLVVDQFEEVFTVCRDEAERAAFIDCLVRAAKGGRALVVTAIRADFYGRCAAHSALAELLGASHVLVGPMNTEEYRRAIEQPAQRAGLRVEPALVDALVAEVVHEPGGLPLLSTALLELWQRRDNRMLRMAAYQATGGVRGAVTRLAEEAYARLSEPQRAVARAVLLRLSAGEGDSAVRRRVPLTELDAETNPDVERVLSVLIDARLLTVSEGAVEIAHEALLREWPRLRAWLDEDRAGRRLRQHLTEAAKGWADSGRDPAELYRGARLTGALDWRAEHGIELNELEREFLDESRSASQRDAERQRRTNRRLRGLLAGVAVLFIASLIGGGFALAQRAEAERAAAEAEEQRTVADAERLGAEALAHPNLDVALLLAREGLGLHDSLATRGNLFAALLRSPAASAVRRPLPGPLLGAQLSPDGTRMLIEDAERVAVLDVASGTVDELEVFAGAGGFAEDGTIIVARLVAGRQIGSLALYDADTAQYLRSVELPSQRRGVHWAPDLQTISYVAADGRFLTVRDLATREERQLAAPAGHEFVDVYQFSDGHVLALLREGPAPEEWSAALEEPLIYGWLAPGAEQPTTVFRSDVGLEPLSVSPDLSTLAIGHSDGSVTLQSLAGGERRALRGGHASRIETIRFSDDGRWLVTASRDRTAIVWDVATGEVRERLVGHTRGVAAAAVWSRDDTVIAYTAGLDGLLMTWNISGGERTIGKRFLARRGVDIPYPPVLALSADGRLLAVPHDDGSVTVRETESFDLVAELAPTGLVSAFDVEFSPDGGLLAVAGEGSRPVQLFDTSTWSLAPQTLPGLPSDSIGEAVAISPDGRMLAAAVGTGRTVRLWNLGADQPVGEPIVESVSGATGFDVFVADLAFSAGSDRLALGMTVGTQGIASVWEVQSRDRLHQVDADPGGGFSWGTIVAFSPDGRVLATGGSDGAVRFWDAETGESTGAALNASDDLVASLGWDRTGRQLVTTAGDGTVRLFDVAAREQIGGSLPGNRGDDVGAAATFSADGSTLFVVYTDGTGIAWDVTVDGWKEHACRVAGRNLTEAEWERFLPDRPYRPSCPEQP